MAKKKLEVVDGLGPRDIKRIRSALRDVWRWSHARKLCTKRAELPHNYFRCEQCRLRVPKIFIDHIRRVGAVDRGFIERLFCPSTELQALCGKCHTAKTRQEREDAKW